MRNKFRLVLVVALVLSGAGLAAPSALASLSGPTPAAAAFKADHDGDGDDKPPVVVGRDNDNRNSLDNGSGCFYPPTNKPRINLFDPNRKFRSGDQVTLRGKVSIGKCGIEGLKVKLYQSRNGGLNNWQPVPGVDETSTTASGSFNFTVTLQFNPPFQEKVFFRVSSDGTQYGFAITNSNIVKIERK